MHVSDKCMQPATNDQRPLRHLRNGILTNCVLRHACCREAGTCVTKWLFDVVISFEVPWLTQPGVSQYY